MLWLVIKGATPPALAATVSSSAAAWSPQGLPDIRPGDFGAECTSTAFNLAVIGFSRSLVRILRPAYERLDGSSAFD
jgi:hypothetical protein